MAPLLASHQFVLRHRFRQFRSPAEPGPLPDVISKTGPESFHPYLEQPTKVKLPEAKLLFDPGMGEFGDGASLLVNLLRLFCRHFLHKKNDRGIRHAPHDRTSARPSRAALPLMGTQPTVLLTCPVDMARPPGELFLSVMPERPSFRTGVGIVPFVVHKVFGAKGVSHPPVGRTGRQPGSGPLGIR